MTACRSTCHATFTDKPRFQTLSTPQAKCKARQHPLPSAVMSLVSLMRQSSCSATAAGGGYQTRWIVVMHMSMLELNALWISAHRRLLPTEIETSSAAANQLQHTCANPPSAIPISQLKMQSNILYTRLQMLPVPRTPVVRQATHVQY